MHLAGVRHDVVPGADVKRQPGSDPEIVLRIKAVPMRDQADQSGRKFVAQHLSRATINDFRTKQNRKKTSRLRFY